MNMKTSLSIVLITLTTIAVFSSSALGDMVQIGDGNTYNAYPTKYSTWANYWENVRTQTLYLASDIGGPQLITDIAWEFQRVSSDPLRNVSIKILEVSDSALIPGDFLDMTDATTVLTASSLVPATSPGWNVIDITDYAYASDKNLVIETLWGDNGSWTYYYNRTYKTEADDVRMLLGYADSQTPPAYHSSSRYYDNIRLYSDVLPAVVPTPSAALLGLLGLSAAGAKLRRRWDI